MIETLRAQLKQALKRQFGPRGETIAPDQIALFTVDDAAVVELPEVPETSGPGHVASVAAPRKRAVRILKDLPRDVRIVDLPECEKACACCGNALHRIGEECSEQLAYVPAALKIIETRRLKYACKVCPGQIRRAPADATPPLAKSMASPSLLAFLIVSKFADGLPLYRIARRLERLGIELSHSLMSDWLIQCAELLEDVHRRMLARVLESGHVFTDDTVLPLQHHDPGRRSTIKARLWVYARHHRRHRPLVTYEFSRSRSRDVAMARFKHFRGYIQADAYPAYDALYADPAIQEVACMTHARRKFVEVADLLKEPGRPHEAIAFIQALYRIERQIRSLDDADRHAQRQRRALPILAQFRAWLEIQANAVLPKSGLGMAVSYALKNWDALCRYTEQGYLEIDNNYSERCMRPVAIGRKAFLFVGSERGGRAAAVYYSLVESCKINRVNPLTYLTYLLDQVRKKVPLLLPDEFAGSAIHQIG